MKFLIKNLNSIELPIRSVIFREGDLSDYFYIIEEGEVELSKNIDD